jgi:uncharacterized DUF497 family protein
MEITFDPEKRDRTLAERGLDFADAGRLFAGQVLTRPDDRRVNHVGSGDVVHHHVSGRVDIPSDD